MKGKIPEIKKAVEIVNHIEKNNGLASISFY